MHFNNNTPCRKTSAENVSSPAKVFSAECCWKHFLLEIVYEIFLRLASQSGDEIFFFFSSDVINATPISVDLAQLWKGEILHSNAQQTDQTLLSWLPWCRLHLLKERQQTLPVHITGLLALLAAPGFEETPETPLFSGNFVYYISTVITQVTLQSLLMLE